MRAIRTLLIAMISALVASIVAYVAFLRPKIRVWGFDEQEAGLALPGDDLVGEPSAVETRGITIDASPSAVWPWLVQMGYGRGGWYSYGPLDSKSPSADQILPEFQQLNVGDMMPTYPGAAFEVKALEPDRALVLFTNTALARSQMEAAGTEATERTLPEFAASWTFYVQPEGSDKTRLIERFRVQAPTGRATSAAKEVMGTGMVLMARKQLIGIKERVERADQTPEAAFATA